MDVFLSPVIAEILSFLELKEVTELLVVSRAFYLFGTSELIWGQHTTDLFPWFSGRGSYKYFVSNIAAFQAVSLPLKGIAHHIHLQAPQNLYGICFHEYLRCPTISQEIYAKLNVLPTFPNELFHLHRVFQAQNGATAQDLPYGMLGSYKFYDNAVNYELLSLDRALEVFKYPLFPIAQCRISHSTIGIDLANELRKGKGAIYEDVRNMPYLFLSEDLKSFLGAHHTKVQNHSVSVKRGTYLNLIETNQDSSDCTTQGIRIQANCRFSLPYSARDRLLWVYQITISPENPSKRWKLTTRTWLITDHEGNTTTVDRQPGVIGLYPIIQQGAEAAVYESCTPLQFPGGKMSGTFTFKNLDNPTEEVDAQVAEFQLRLPTGSFFVARHDHNNSA